MNASINCKFYALFYLNGLALFKQWVCNTKFGRMWHNF